MDNVNDPGYVELLEQDVKAMAELLKKFANEMLELQRWRNKRWNDLIEARKKLQNENS